LSPEPGALATSGPLNGPLGSVMFMGLTGLQGGVTSGSTIGAAITAAGSAGGFALSAGAPGLTGLCGIVGDGFGLPPTRVPLRSGAIVGAFGADFPLAIGSSPAICRDKLRLAEAKTPHLDIHRVIVVVDLDAQRLRRLKTFARRLMSIAALDLGTDRACLG